MKKKKNIRKWLYNIAILFFLGVMVYAACNLIPLLIQDHQDNETQKEWESLVLREPNEEEQQEIDGEEEDQEPVSVVLSPDWNALQSTNPDIVGWIYIPDTVINYPIVQGSDNDYYLDHSSMNNTNTIGSIFLDAAASADFTDLNTIVYGHSVTQSNAMFTQLALFEDQSFFESHRYIYILTLSQNYRCEIMALTKTKSDSFLYQIGFAPNHYWTDYLDQMMAEAMYTHDVGEISENDRVVMLSTCDLDYGVGSEYRILLHARLQNFDGVIRYEQ